MIGLENLSPEMATDLIVLINSLQKLPKTCKVAYNVKNKATGQWVKKEFSYTPLDDILEKIKENTNFAFMQPIGYDKEIQKFGVKCVLIHKSGKYIISDLYEIPVKEDTKIQDEGAEITYRKRYSAGAFLGLATEEDTNGNDDDAEPVKSEKPVEEKKVVTASPKQISTLLQHYQGENLTKLLKANNIDRIEDLPIAKASELISTILNKGGK